MTKHNLDSRQTHPGTFRFDISGGVSAGAFVVTIAMSLWHGDIAAIPALLALAAMVFVVLSIHTPPETGSLTGRRNDRASQTSCHRTHLWRRHCLGQ